MALLLAAPAPAAGPANDDKSPWALTAYPTQVGRGLASRVVAGRAGRGSDVGERATENAQGPAPVTCISCGHGPTSHNDGHKAYWVREVA